MITVYSKEGCPRCDDAKALLGRFEIDYQEVRIDLDDDARNFLVANGHRSVPQLYVEDTVLVRTVDELFKMTAEEITQKVIEIGN